MLKVCHQYITNNENKMQNNGYCYLSYYIYAISDDEGVDTGGGTSSNESNSPIK